MPDHPPTRSAPRYRQTRDTRSTPLRRVAAIVLLAVLSPVTRALEVDLLGVDGQMADNIRSTVGLFRLAQREAVSRATQAFYLRAVSEEVRRALEPFGFYEAGVEVEREEPDRIVLRVDPGPPVRIRSIEIRILQDGEPFAPAAELPPFPLAVGHRLDHALYESGKIALRDALLDAGYLDVQALQRSVEVDVDARAADIRLAWDAGPLHHFGEVRFEGAQFGDAFMARYLPFESGDVFSQDRLLDLGTRLRNSGYFDEVNVTPDLEQASPVVPVAVRVTPMALDFYSVALLWGTDTGPGLELEAVRRWLNDRGHRVQAALDLTTRRQLVSAIYDIPRRRRFDAFYQLSASASLEETDSFDSEAFRLRASHFRRWRGWNRIDTVEYLHESSDFGTEETTADSLLASIGLTRARIEGGVIPTRGHSLRLSVGGGINPGVLRSSIEGRRVDSFGEHWRVLLRGGAGALTTGDFDALAASQRFFAGGDRSVRGYDFNALGSRNEAGDVIGGRYLLEGSVELERRLAGPWRAAAFLDAGNAFSSGDEDLELGAGFGVRYATPVGLVRVDVGFPVTRDDLGPRLHLVIGPQL